jgi:hypothetical protein
MSRRHPLSSAGATGLDLPRGEADRLRGSSDAPASSRRHPLERRELLLLLRDLAGLLRSLLHCALRLLCLLSFLRHVALQCSEMALFAVCTRESRCTTSRIHQHVEKNSVPLKEVLTEQSARMQRALLARAQMRVHDDARSAASIDVDACQQCRKCLCRNDFFNSYFSSATRFRRCGCANESSKNAPRGLRVGNFGNKKIFADKPPTSHRRSPKPDFWTNRCDRFATSFAVAASNCSSRSTRKATSRASWTTSATMSPHRVSAALRCRASTSGDR